METKKIGNRKTRVGTVVSNKMEKTIVVVVERRVLQDSENTARIGDHVLIEETRPISKNKCWRLKEIIRRAPVL